MIYNWCVLVDNKIIGYVRSNNEVDAIKIAKEKLFLKSESFFIEKTYLGNPIPVEKEYCFSSSFLNTKSSNAFE